MYWCWKHMETLLYLNLVKNSPFNFDVSNSQQQQLATSATTVVVMKKVVLLSPSELSYI